MKVQHDTHPIRDYRQQRNLTINELADDIGISSATLHNLEYNRGQYAVRMVIAYCVKKGIDVTIFFPPDARITKLKKVKCA